MTITYNKLVRDRIPEIIQASGKKCSTEILSDEEYAHLNREQLKKELAGTRYAGQVRIPEDRERIAIKLT